MIEAHSWQGGTPLPTESAIVGEKEKEILFLLLLRIYLLPVRFAGDLLSVVGDLSIHRSGAEPNYGIFPPYAHCRRSWPWRVLSRFTWHKDRR